MPILLGQCIVGCHWFCVLLVMDLLTRLRVETGCLTVPPLIDDVFVHYCHILRHMEVLPTTLQVLDTGHIPFGNSLQFRLQAVK